MPDGAAAAAEWDEARASKLRGMLEASIQRRFPKGLKVHIRSVEKNGCLTELAQRLRTANLSITRAKVGTQPLACKAFKLPDRFRPVPQDNPWILL